MPKFFVLIAILALFAPLGAQVEHRPATFQPSRIKALEASIQSLESRLDSLHALRFQDQDSMEEEEEDEDSGEPKLLLSGFGHVQFDYQHISMTGGGTSNSNAFALGGLDLFLRSQLNEKVSFLNETVFEPNSDGENVLDVERLIIKYEINDDFNVQAGRFHSSFGYWNRAFHHGEFLSTSIGRPDVLKFEDDGGLLPIHIIGLLFEGRYDTESFEFAGNLEIGNGRGPVPDPPQIVVDGTMGKSLNLHLTAKPKAIEGLEIGVGGYLDRIPANTDASKGTVHGKLNESILSFQATYQNENWVLLGEAFFIHHGGGGSPSADSNGYYLQLAYQHEDWTPYLRFDAINVYNQDVFLASLDDRTTIALGVRYDFAEMNALKLQLSFTDVNAATGADSEEWTLSSQWSFGF